ncbi:MAG TPA: asparagine synthase (glutamine-hydrolyzing) [Gemmatimonadaceae bacterium]|jgi:asparagine synthase (glutamine-hydrolysing)
MCGIAGIVGARGTETRAMAERMIAVQRHRGPDATGIQVDAVGGAVLAHARLSILDLSTAGAQPMASADGRYHIVFNGEIYNYVELRAALRDHAFRSRGDTEVLLAAYAHWGPACLDRLVGMFSFAIWDARDRTLFAARDRFGVKPFVYHRARDGALAFASEIKALWAAGVAAAPNAAAWATYLAYGISDQGAVTFWEGVEALPAGHHLTWHAGETRIARWYDLAQRVGDVLDERAEHTVREEYRALLEDSVRLRFRSDVPVGIALSGGVDSSTLLGLVQAVQGADSDVQAFTFTTGHPGYDELPWVRETLAQTRHSLVECRLTASDVPALAESVQRVEDEPFGGIPTLAYARLFEQARERGVIVLLDGQGLDEQWAGYDYYARVLAGKEAGVVQGSVDRPVRPECLTPSFRALAQPLDAPSPFGDALRNLQYRDAQYTKIPRALRFNDRASMRASVELREPFLDHRLFELALRQPANRKIAHGVHKRMLREIAAELLPKGVVEAPKRPLQTPQREWLRGPLHEWAESRIEEALTVAEGDWLDASAVRAAWRAFAAGAGDNSFFVWQWLSLGLIAAEPHPRPTLIAEAV